MEAEKFALFNNMLSNRTLSIALYSFLTNTVHQLPPIPEVATGIPQSCQCVTLDGKIYILGGITIPLPQLTSPEVYVFDFATQGPWKKCSSMQASRCAFAAEVIEGRIFVCGGSSNRAPVSETELYNPNSDTWTTLAPMPLSQVRINHKVAISEGNLLIYDGEYFSSHYQQRQAMCRQPNVKQYTIPAREIDMYNPAHNTWAQLHTVSLSPAYKTLFMREGTLYSFLSNELLQFNWDMNIWRRVKRVLYPLLESRQKYHRLCLPTTTICLDDQELLAFGPMAAGNEHWQSSSTCLCRTVGLLSFGVSWQTLLSQVSLAGLQLPFIRILQV